MIKVFVDGASKGHPGPSGAGIYVKADKTYEYAIPLGNLSNHEAEFQAVYQALIICAEHFPDEILAFHSDSQIVVDSIEKNFTKNNHFTVLLEEILKRAKQFPLFFIKWIPNKQNHHADRLAKRAIQLNDSELPFAEK